MIWFDKCSIHDFKALKPWTDCFVSHQAGWEARGLRSGRGGYGSHQEGGGLRQQQRQNQRPDRHRRLRPALGASCPTHVSCTP